MPEYAWVFLNKEDSEYAYGIWIWQGSQYASVSQRFEYAKIFLPWQSSEYILDSKYASVLNMKVTQGPKYATIWLNISELDVNTPEDV